MRLVSWNVNGIRAAIRKGIDGYFSSIDADIWMLQEVRALPEQLPKNWSWPEGYDVHLHTAEKKVTQGCYIVPHSYGGYSNWQTIKGRP